MIDRVMYLVRHPSSLTTPTVENRHLERCYIGCGSLHVLVNLSELGHDMLNLIDEARPVVCELQIAAVADTIEWGTKQRTPRLPPVVPCLSDRINALAEDIREEIRKQSSLGILHAPDIGNHPKRDAASDRADDRIEADPRKVLPIWLCADPVIAEEHHRFLTIGMNDINELLCQRTDLNLLELDKITEFLAWYAEHTIMIALIHDKLRTEPVACPLLEFLQDIWTDTRTVTEPLDELLSLLVIEGQCELMKEGRESNDIDIWILLAPLFQLIFYILLCLRLTYIIRQLMRRILPVIRDGIIHMHWVPDQKSKEADRIFMIWLRLNLDFTSRLIEKPLIHRDDVSGRAVDDLPPALRII